MCISFDFAIGLLYTQLLDPKSILYAEFMRNAIDRPCTKASFTETSHKTAADIKKFEEGWCCAFLTTYAAVEI